MKIHPPTVGIDPEDPFKEALFGRKAFANSLTNLLRNTSENLVVIVHAPWGEGKSTFAAMWQAELLRQKLNIISFDAFAADYVEDPFVCFSGEILGLADKLSGDNGVIRRQDFKKKAVEVAKHLAGLVTKVVLKSATMGVIDETHIKQLKEIKAELGTGVAKFGSEAIEKKIAHYSAEKDSFTTFKKSLAELAAAVREEQGFPLLIIVDELDRCRPDFALALLERIKHLFDVDGVAFVLLVNRDQIESYIKTVYGDVDARAYLLKFANLFVDLPHGVAEYQLKYERGLRDYCQILFTHHALQIPNPRALLTPTQLLTEHFRLTLREVEKVFVILGLYCSSYGGEFTNHFLVALLSVLKVKLPDLYKELGAAACSLAHFWEQTRIDQINVRNLDVDIGRCQDVVRYCLLSELEFEKIREENEKSPVLSMAQWFHMQRTTIIPYLCSSLDRFSLKP
jgi:hypothetical protein